MRMRKVWRILSVDISSWLEHFQSETMVRDLGLSIRTLALENGHEVARLNILSQLRYVGFSVFYAQKHLGSGQ